jgi:DNA-binding NarL/FixJ family response regulator
MAMTTTRVRAAICADDPVSRAGLVAELASCHGIELLEDSDAADVVVIVTHEVDEPAMQLTRRVRRTGGAGVVLVVAQIDDQGLFAAVEAGVSALLRRSEATPERLAQAIEEASQGNGTMPSDLLGRLMRQVNHLHDRVLGPQGMHLNGLSDREIEVLRLVADGHATSDIAATLCYSERTIKNVIQGITLRLNLRNRSHAVAYAMRHGLI